MKFTTNTKDFADAIIKTSKALNKTIHILQNIKVDISENSCTFTGFDLENSVVTTINAYNTVEGSFVFDNTDTLIKAIKHFKDDEITLEIDKTVNIKCGSRTATQNILPASDYANLPIFEAEQKYSYNIKKLVNRFNLIKYAIAKTDTRPVLTGVCFNGIDMVTCDGFRAGLNSDETLNITNKIIVPETTLKLCSTILNGDITIKSNSKYISIADKNTVITGRLLAGEYIDYKTFFTNLENKIIVNTKEFTEEVKYLKEFSDSKVKKYNTIALYNGQLSLISKGNYRSTVKMTGDTATVFGFGINYLADCLTQFQGDITIEYKNSTNHFIFRDNSNGNNVALLMPVRIEDVKFEHFPELLTA